MEPLLVSQTGSRNLVIGFRDMVAAKSATQTAIRTKLDAKKKTGYASSGVPYVIALNVVEPAPLMDEEIVGALFGPEKIHITHRKGEVLSAEFSRHYEGFWQENGQPRNSRVQALIVFHNLSSLDLLDSNPRMFFAPVSNPLGPLRELPYFRRYIWNHETYGYDVLEASPYASLLGFA